MVLGTSGLFGGTAYYLWANSESKETNVNSETIFIPNAPKWFNKIRNAKGSLPPELKNALDWSKQDSTEATQNTVANWIKLFCKEEPHNYELRKEYCDEELYRVA